MKPFETIKKNLAILYFSPNTNADSWFELVVQHRSCFLKSALSLTSLFAYLICVAKTSNEFMFSVFLSVASFFIFVAFSSTVFKTSALFDFLNYADHFFLERKKALFDTFEVFTLHKK